MSSAAEEGVRHRPPLLDGKSVMQSSAAKPPLAAPLPSLTGFREHSPLSADKDTGAGRPQDRRRRHPRQRRSSSAAAVKKRYASISGSLRLVALALWALTTLTALTLGVIADVFQAEGAEFPLVPVVGTSIGLNAVAVGLVVILGKLTKRGFAVFQPFSGGPKFTLMQAAGYSLVMLSALGMLLLVETLQPAGGPPRARYGAYTVLSGFSVVAQILLVTSLLFFRPPSESPASSAGATGGSQAQGFSFRDITASPAGEYVFATLCCSLAVASAALAEVYPAYRPISVVVVLCFTSVAMGTLSYLARRFVPTYRMVTLAPQAFSLTALQLLGNVLLLLCFCGCLILHSARVESPPSWHLGVALIGVTGVCCHQLLVRLTHSREKEATAAAAALADAAVNPQSRLIRDFASVQVERRLRSLNGAVMSTGVSFALAAALYGISAFLSLPLTEQQQQQYPRHGQRARRDEYIAQGLLQVQMLLEVLLFAMPPFTHLQGRLVFGKGYELWQPFKGTVEFVLLQAAAWASYAFAVLFGTLQASEPSDSFSFLLLLTTALLFSQLFAHVSLYLFDESKHRSVLEGPDAVRTQHPHSHSLSPDGAVEDGSAHAETELSSISLSQSLFPLSASSSFSSVVLTRSLVATVMNGELLLAIVLSVASMLLRGVCDTVKHARMTGSRGTSLKVPTAELISGANVLSLLATPIAQFSMHDRIPFMHVTSTSVSFNVLQTIAWLVYMALLFLTVLSTVTKKEHLFMCSADHLFMEHTAQGLVFIIPLLCVMISDVCETQERAVSNAATLRARHAAEALARYFGVDQRPLAERKRAVELIRNVAGPRLASTDWGVALTLAHEDTQAEHKGEKKDPKRDGLGRAHTLTLLNDEAEQERIDADKQASVTAARYITVIMCLACAAAFTSAAFLADSQPVTTLLFGVAGVLVLSLSCVSLQVVLGTRLHGGTGRYALFMPFVGGNVFVVWQAVGWACYTVVVCLMIACVVEGRGSRSVFLIMGVLSVFAGGAVFHSIPLFDPIAVSVGSGFVGNNAEGLLAATILLGTFSFARAYDLAREGSVSSNASALVPFTIMSVAMCLTVPMGLLSLQRQVEHYGVSPFTFFDTVEDSDDSDAASADNADGRSDSLFFRESLHDDAEGTPSSSAHGATTGEEGGSAGVSRCGSSLWAPSPMTPAVREGLIRHARTESLASTTAGASPRRGSLVSRSSQSGSSSVPLGTPRNTHSPMPREASGFASGFVSSSHRARPSSYTIAISYAVSLLIALFLVSLLPFAVVFMAYSYVHNAQITYAAGTRTLEVLVACFVLVVVLPMVVPPIVRRSRPVRWVHSALCAWMIYSIPTMTVLSGVLPPFFIDTRGAWLFAINMCTMSCLSTIPYVHLLAFIFSVFCCGFFAQYHLYSCLFLHKAPFVPWKCLFDLSCALFWLWYGRRYVSRPEITGCYQSNKASRFFQTHVFQGMARWFSLKVVLADLYLLPSERGVITLVQASSTAKSATSGGKSGEARDEDGGDALRSQTHRRAVDRRKPENQFLFSFHPHGVFPGTALYAPKTLQFERAVGANSVNFISTHCADVIFSVPLMREFPLCLGSLSVSRAGIDYSIRAGNSPLIVTGGQSEMLLVKMSSTEMHLVCHHLGFIKVALRYRIPLVPVLSFSECNIMDNIHCLGVQRWFLKRVGFPFPTLPHGFMKLPLPTNTPMSLVIGPPLMPLPGRENHEDLACQEEMRVRYFSHLEYLFYRYREAVGYPEMKLYLHYDINDEGVLATPPPKGTDVAKDYVLNEEDAAICRAIAAFKRNKEAREAKKAAALAEKQAKKTAAPRLDKKQS